MPRRSRWQQERSPMIRTPNATTTAIITETATIADTITVRATSVGTTTGRALTAVIRKATRAAAVITGTDIRRLKPSKNLRGRHYALRAPPCLAQIWPKDFKLFYGITVLISINRSSKKANFHQIKNVRRFRFLRDRRTFLLFYSGKAVFQGITQNPPAWG